MKIIIIKLNSFLNSFYVSSHNNRRLSCLPSLTFDKKSFARFSNRYSKRDVSTMTSGSSSQTVVAVDPSTFGANISSLISFQNNFTYRYEVDGKEQREKKYVSLQHASFLTVIGGNVKCARNKINVSPPRELALKCRLSLLHPPIPISYRLLRLLRDELVSL